MSEGLKIVELRAENVKKLKAVEIRPEGSTVVISGKNEQGKSSVLDSIWYALGGAEAMKGVKKPIREGAEKAQVRVDLGDIIVTRKWTGDDKTYLEVSNKDGAVFKSPQAILDALIGNLSFDPLAFSNMPDKKQMEVLLELVKIDLDLNKWEADRKTKYEERTLVNRRVKELEGQIAGLPIVPEDTPDEEVSMASIASEMEEARVAKESNDERRRELDRQKNRIEQTRERIGRIGNKVDEIFDAIEKLKQDARSLEVEKKNEEEVCATLAGTINRLEAEVSTLVDPDMSDFKEKMTQVETINTNVRAKQQRVSLDVQILKTKTESNNLSFEMDALDEQKTTAIKAAKFPIEGLGFDDSGVTYKGIPFGQCSSAERLRVSLAMAMSLNPKLRVLRIMDGSLLDSQNMAVIEEMVKDNGYQCWIEKVDESGKVGIYIEDGEVVAKEEQEVA